MACVCFERIRPGQFSAIRSPGLPGELHRVVDGHAFHQQRLGIQQFCVFLQLVLILLIQGLPACRRWDGSLISNTRSALTLLSGGHGVEHFSHLQGQFPSLARQTGWVFSRLETDCL